MRPRLGSRSSAGRNALRIRAASSDTRADVVGLDGQLGGLHALGAEALDHPHAADRLLDDGGQLGLLGLHGEHRRVDPREKRWASTLTSGSGARAITASSGCEVISSTTIGDDHRQVRERHRDHHDEALDLHQVARRPAHQLAGLGAVVEAEVQAQVVPEQLVAQARSRSAGSRGTRASAANR